jgi:hypothetical protein
MGNLESCGVDCSANSKNGRKREVRKNRLSNTANEQHDPMQQLLNRQLKKMDHGASSRKRRAPRKESNTTTPTATVGSTVKTLDEEGDCRCPGKLCVCSVIASATNLERVQQERTDAKHSKDIM